MALKEWQKEHLKKKMKAEMDVEGSEDFRMTEEPESMVQGFIKDFYETLRDGNGNPDTFDSWFEDSEYKSYRGKHHFVDFLQKVLDKCQVREDFSDEDLKTKDIEKALYRIAEKIGEGDVNIHTVREVINDRYPSLVAKMPEGMCPEEYRAKMEDHIEQEVEDMAEGVEPREKFEDYFDEFEAYNENSIDSISQRLNRMVDLGMDVWSLTLYSSLSASADKFHYGGRPTRSSLHTLFIGDISTAKSKTLGIIDEISPNSEIVDKMTEASLIGSYDTSKKEFQEGVIDRVQNGNLIMEEYDKSNNSQDILRKVFDNNNLNVPKGQARKLIEEVRVSIMAGANPDDDFFTNQDEVLRDQIPFDEGELSRFDVLIPLTNTAEQMEKYVEDMTFFGSREENSLDDVAKTMDALNTKINSIDQVEIGQQKVEVTEDNIEKVSSYKNHTEPDDLEIGEEVRIDLIQAIKTAFNNQQQELTQNKFRPTLIIMRDLEILMRLVHIIGCVKKEPKDGFIEIDIDVVSEAVSQFETIIDLRERLYTNKDRSKLANTPKGEVYWKLVEVSGEGDEEVLKSDLKDECMREGIVNNKQTFYNKIDELIKERKVKVTNPEKNRYKKVKPLA